MTITTLPIANGFYKSDSLPIAGQECTNWYPNLVQAQALNQETLFGTPGSVQLATTGAIQQENRGAITLEGIPYFVNGTSLVRLNRTIVDEVESFSITTLGTIVGTSRVSVANNGTQIIIIVPGVVSTGYIFTESPDTLTIITDADFKANGEPQHVIFVDGYFLLTTDSKKFIISALNDGLTYNALDFGTAETDPDDIVAPVVLKNQAFIGGTTTMEPFQNLPQGADFPFVRTGLFLDKGISAPFSIINANNTFMFVGGGKKESPAIWQFVGNELQKVSTTAIDSILQDITDTELSEVFSWSYAQSGAYFVGFALPNTTLVIDSITGRWHERKSQIIDARGDSQIIRSRINSLVSAYGRILVGDSQDGRIGDLRLDEFREYGNEILRTVATQPFQNNMQSFTVPSLELTMESGVGNSDVPDPKIRMDRSLDGKTFKDERTRKIGKVGEFRKRAIWRRNGRAARFEIFRFKMSDPVRPVIIQLTADILG